MLWFFIRLGTVPEVNFPCSPVQAQVESGTFPVCYNVHTCTCITIYVVCVCASLIHFHFCNQVDCCTGMQIYSFRFHCCWL